MGEILGYAWICAAGAAIGVLFFGGLWWTVRNAVDLPVPALWFLGSSMARTGLALAGFWFLTGGNWRRVLACLVGFLAGRIAVTWTTRTAGDPNAVPASEVRDAP
jgi:F1F0 ATPase subunit 2